MSALGITSATRSALGQLVEREERRTGSRDVAYEVVAQSVGASSSWIRKFLQRSDEVKEPRITLFLNIRLSYERLCERIETEHELELLKIKELRRELDAPVSGFVEMVERAPQAAAARTEEG